ncbi:MAG: hypothetical protein MI866_12900 [Bacteroidales bacterium]|nr:hypothetical protein [Bacteroidales bacterium]
MPGLQKNIKCILVMTCLLGCIYCLKAQSVNFAIKTSPAVHLDFNTVQKYVSGITVMNVCELNVETVGTQWDLYVGATTTVPGEWDVNSVYSAVGSVPPINILQLQFRNASSTSQVPGFFPIQDILSPTYIIGSAVAPDPAVNCPAVGTNQAGNYLATPSCYKFNVDMKVVPGFGLQPGSYSIRIDYVLVQDL